MRFMKRFAVAAVAAGIWAGSATSASAAPYIDMMTDMEFTNGAGGSVECQPILIADDGANFTVASDIRLLIPTSYSMTWVTDASAEILVSGSVTFNATNVTYALTPQSVCRLDVTGVSAAGDKIVVTGLSLQGWAAAQTFDSLGMAYDTVNLATEAVAANQGFCTSESTVGVKISSANNFCFNPTGAAGLTPTLPNITLTDSSTTAVFTAASDLRITIPAYSTANPFGSYGTAPTFDTTVTTVIITGTATTNVSTTVTYANGSRTCVLDVTANFATSQAITVAGLKFAITSAETYTVDSLQLSRDGGFATINALDDRVFCVGPANISMTAIQTVSASAANEAVTSLTITDHATTATITALSDIRLLIMNLTSTTDTPQGRGNLSWDAAASGTASYTGTGASKMTSAATTAAETGNGAGTRLILLKVTTNFAAGDSLTVDGLKVDNSVATATNLHIGLILAGYTDADVTKGFGRVVNIVTPQNVTGTSGTAAKSTSSGGCFLRALERDAAQ
jgi:hypothetical protein